VQPCQGPFDRRRKRYADDAVRECAMRRSELWVDACIDGDYDLVSERP
jgi:hypothetical protein